mmetsp:Transcript_6780/g.11399  ORF Transcript_6780/g.11399 Transcript_6780/m.11399 type:complete len:107 (+) Transcript_6780:334-654(+)
MIGNVYIKYATEEQAQDCFTAMQGKLYNDLPIQAEFSPVTDFREAKCRVQNEGHCNRGGFCNFIHPKFINKKLRRELQDMMYDEYPEYKKARDERIERGEDEDLED